MSFVRQSRRRFLRTLVGAGGVAGSASLLAQERPFRGSRAGQTRVVDNITLCWCPPGRFVMGSPPLERGHRPDEAQVEVVLTRGFWTAQQEVTQQQWRQVVGKFPDQPPSAAFGEGDNFPVYWISADEAEAFCAELTRRGRRAGALPEAWEFRLPTEAQWEYACRAGTTSATPFGETVGLHQANFAGELVDRALPAKGRARPVGSYPANPWGIHDMLGNVWEWCRDWYHTQLPGVRIPICTTCGVCRTATALIRASGAGAPGSKRAGRAAPPAACASNPTVAPTTSAFASSRPNDDAT